MSTFEFWTLQIPGWLLVAYLAVAQCVPAFSYKTGVRMGTQEPAESITEVGVATWWAFAFGDLVFYTPLLALGLVGQLLTTTWAPLVLAAAFGVTVYWPIVCLAAVHRSRGAAGWSLPKEWQYWIVLPTIALWGLWGLVALLTP